MIKRLAVLAALLAVSPALAKDTASYQPPPPPVTISGDGVILTPSGMTLELGPGASAVVTPEGVMITGTVTLKGGSVLVAPVKPTKALGR